MIKLNTGLTSIDVYQAEKTHKIVRSEMRIGLVSTMRTSVPPPKTGSVELLVGLMAEELVRRGHDVTVFAPKDSRLSARVLSILPVGYHHDETIWDWELAEFMQMGLVYEHANEFDIINSHVYCYALPFSRLVSTPTVNTFHICPTPDFVRYCRMYPDANNILISNFQRNFFSDIPVANIIYNGVDTAAFPYSPDTGKYLAYLGVFRPDKGPLEAIRLAKSVGIPIKLAGPYSHYLDEVIKPELDGKDVEYVGELDHAGKASFLSGAIALLFPVEALEACPLVILESMACGTPILALSSGPIPELVEQGISGYYAENLDELSQVIDNVQHLDRTRIRQIAIERFDVSRMVDKYMSVFQSILDSKFSSVHSRPPT